MTLSEHFTLEDDEDFIDVRSLEWEEHEQVTQARSPSSGSPFFPGGEDDGGDARPSLRGRAVAASRPGLHLHAPSGDPPGLGSVESVPSLASLRAEAAASRPPPDSDADLTRPIQPPWLAAYNDETRVVAPPRPPAPGLPVRTDDFDARVTARRPRVTPLPPSRSAVIQLAAQQAQPTPPRGQPRENPDASLALPLLRPSAEAVLEAEVVLEAVLETGVEAVVAPLPSEPPRPSVPPSRWMEDIGVEQRELRREIAELRSWVRVTTLLATLAALACVLLAGVLAATS